MNRWHEWLNEALSCCGIALSVDIAETKEVLGLILVILNIIILVISFGAKVFNWFKHSTADGEITDEEMGQLENIVEDSANKVGSLIDKTEEKKND